MAGRQDRSQDNVERRQRLPSLNTTSAPSRFSYIAGAESLSRPGHDAPQSPVTTIIDDTPLDPASAYPDTPAYERQQDAHNTPAESHLLLPQDDTPRHTAYNASQAIGAPQPEPIERRNTPYDQPALQEVHPAHYAPYASPRSPQAAVNLPLQQLQPYPDQAKQPQAPSSSETKFSDYKPPYEQRAPSYKPDSVVGPNGALLDAHRPGQVGHPNLNNEPTWKHGLCEADTLCCTTLLCPCMIYGRVQYRLDQKGKKKEATDLLGYESMNAGCISWTALCGGFGILTMIQRARIRKTYNIEGGFADDCVNALCCCCCTLAQHEREIKTREEHRTRYAGPIITPYVSPQAGMSYAPPPR